MYSDVEDDDEGYNEPTTVSSSMLWVRNLRRYIRSEPALGSEAKLEHETRRILLNLFKEKHRKNAAAGIVPSFYKKVLLFVSLCIRGLELYKVINVLCLLIQKESDILLNSDDLDAMWLCLRENCVIDESTGSEKVNYEDFCQIASLCTEQIGSKCRRFFRPSNFMKFEKDESGRIAILPFYLYVMRTVSLTQARIDMSELDEDSDGFLQPYEMEAYIRGLIPNLAQLRDMPAEFIQMYCHIAAHRFFFFCDPSRRGKGRKRRFCSIIFLHEYNGVAPAFDEHVRHGKTIIGLAWEMDFESFIDFTLALENRDTPEGLTYLFRCLDLHGRGYLTASDIHILFRDVREKWVQIGNYELCTEDVRDEIWDMVKPADPLRITRCCYLSCKQGGTDCSML
ncbi:probable serine/threonine-protein phosphatase 2A regulatory subunit B'' subunit TON2 [Tanacetum coccineum]